MSVQLPLVLPGAGEGTGFPQAFHPAVAAWFERRFPQGPTPPQAAAWPLIAQGRQVLVASPTGTGKTLTGFLVAIDAAYRRQLAGASGPGRLPQVLYVSPLRALAVDVHENLQVPLAGIAEEARRLGLCPPELTVAVRTGDTPATERAAMRRCPPDLLVTTPESLYLLLTAASTRAQLAGVSTVIVDEVHTLARDKRGSHLALSLERLAQVVEGAGGRLQRIGLSATQRPLEVMAGLLGGSGANRPLPEVVDCGHLRRLDVAIELPPSDLEAVTSHTQLGQVLDRLAAEVRQHRTTLIFVNTRRMSERLAHLLAERLEAGGLGDEAHLQVAAHHGSLSPARRRLVEERLRAGQLRALVATASLELGIDVGPVDLVCQIGSPRAIATFLQRVGRANHDLSGVPKGRLFPLTRDELVECSALLAGCKGGRLDAVAPAVAPLDVLAQQLVAEVAARGEAQEDDLYAMVRGAAPYAELSRSDFDDVVELVTNGVATGRGRRGAHLHRDGVHGRLRARRGARLAALTSGGAIPETGDYRVVLDPEGVTVGSVHEDFAVEASVGDVFLLGTHSWRVAKVETGTVRVHDAGGAAPSVPFWLGEAPARTAELSQEVGSLRALVDRALCEDPSSPARAVAAVVGHCGVDQPVAEAVVSYLGEARAALGTLPTRDQVVVERFFDESEGMQLVIHAPYGGGVNRALGLALRKRFCVTFDFELQAAADDDAVLISLGPQHSFPLSQVPAMVSTSRAQEVLTQAVLTHPMLQARWRWNCNRALVVPRSRGGQRRPIHLQRMEADDVLAAAWPSLAACQDNAPPGPVPIADHVLVRQTVHDCLHEALDADGLVALLAELEAGRVGVHLVESPEPSVLAHGILSGRPYTFLDGAPLEERRSRAVPLARGLDHGQVLGVGPAELGPLDSEAAAEVLTSIRPAPRDPDELHDLLCELVCARPVPEWAALFSQLVGEDRAQETDRGWVAAERAALARALDDDDEAAARCVGGHLELAGPVHPPALVGEDPLPAGTLRGAPVGMSRAKVALARLEAEGLAVQLPDGRWCARHLLARLHGASRARRRAKVTPATVSQLVETLCRWQHLAPGTKAEGRAGLAAVVEQLQGMEIAAGEWERSVLPARLEHYDPRWLDELCLSGEVAWGRLTPRAPRPAERQGDSNRQPTGPAHGPRGHEGLGAAVGGTRRGGATPSPSTPLALVSRQDLDWLLQAVRVGEPAPAPEVGAAAEVFEVLAAAGACFRSELDARVARLPAEVDEGLWDLVARGVASADAFSAVRSLLSARGRWGWRQRPRALRRPGAPRRRGPLGSGVGEGRWSLLPGPSPEGAAERDAEMLAEAVAWQLLQRWGVVVWELWTRESFRIPWRLVLRALRRFEARGLVVGGRLVAGLSGEQFALPQAAALLAAVRRETAGACEVVVAGADPCNLTGVLLPGPRVPAVRGRQVRYRRGVLVAEDPPARAAGGD